MAPEPPVSAPSPGPTLSLGSTHGHTATAADGVAALLRRIEGVDRSGPTLRSVIRTNHDAVTEAAALDVEAAAGRRRGPLHGVSVLVKDNIDTAGAMGTTAGSLALAGAGPAADAPLVRRLRDAGMVVLGKTNLSEWANFRSSGSSSGWSAVGGLCVNPHALDRSAGGSSSGSGAAVAAGLAPLAVGTETDGSILCPAALCGVVGIKPTVGLVDGTGIVPISHSQDTAGPIARTVRDAALLLSVLASAGRPGGRGDGSGPGSGAPAGDPPVPGRRAYDDYQAYCRSDGLRGARIGLPRHGLWGYSARADALAEEAVRVLAAQGATIVDPANLPSLDELSMSEAEMTVLATEFKVGIEAYLATRGVRAPDGRGAADAGSRVAGASGVAGSDGLRVPRTLADLMAFNDAHADVEFAHFGQDRFEDALRTGGLDDPAYREALETCRRLGRSEGIDAALRTHDLDALVAPTYPPAWKIDLVNGDHVSGSCTQVPAVAGYPVITVPCGAADGLPVGLAFIGTAWSEPTLIRLAYAFEQALDFSLTPAFRPPQTG
ncbi:amidase family protein [Actinopolymorpha sp. B11F2]|uniref:amidase family protein n=1 Tax=Actinopolymorpha sp. B11F2 TaxID=3160862 RepID=UPI0032E4D57D